MAVTSRDVARLAGVSQPTVSRALRKAPGVSQDTRERVERAAQALGYVPMHSGRTLSTRRTRRIGIVAAELANPYYPALVGPIHDILDEAGYRSILIADGPNNPVDIGSLVDGSVDGVMLTTSERWSTVPHELSRRSIPYVQVGRVVENVEADSAVADNAGGAALVAQLLLDLGHTVIGGVFGPDSTSTGLERRTSFTEALAKRSIAIAPGHILSGRFDYASGHAALAPIMRTDRPPTALFCASDVLALGVLNAAHAMGMRVPEELTVVGFDDIPLAGWDVFALTTVSIDLRRLAAEACRLLLSRLEEPDRRARHIVTPVDLVLRSTHAAPPRPS